jgi:hypothetical protein
MGNPALRRLPTKRMDTLYISLEDSLKHLKKRIIKMCGPLVKGMNITTTLPEGFTLVEYLESVLRKHPSIKFITIDTLRRAIDFQTDDYDSVIEKLGPLQQWAVKKAIYLVVIHHTRKGDQSDDIFESILGSQGIMSVFDQAILFTRPRGGVTGSIKVTGRDIEDCSYSVRLDKEHMIWEIVDVDSEQDSLTMRQKAVYTALQTNKGNLNTSQIAKLASLHESNTSTTLAELKALGLVDKPAHGIWKVSTS